ncbi:cell division protein FtsQ/DivIB [Candidatus Omnitrophota bacterium]
MNKRKLARKETVPKWKKGQKTARRKPGITNRSKRAPDTRLLVGIIRFAAVCIALATVVRYVGVPVVRTVSKHPIFHVREVVVEGAQYLDSDKIFTAANIQQGANIFDLDLMRSARKLKSEFSAEKFTVFRRLPYTVVIEVHERKPVALLNMNKLVGVDSKGVTLPHIGADMVDTLPIITGIKTVSSLSDSTTKQRIVSGIRMLEHISKEAPAVYSRISEVDVTNLADMGISLVDNGLHVIIGNNNWKSKIPNLERVINEVTWRRENAKSLDIRFENKVIVTK